MNSPKEYYKLQNRIFKFPVLPLVSKDLILWNDDVEVRNDYHHEILTLLHKMKKKIPKVFWDEIDSQEFTNVGNKPPKFELVKRYYRPQDFLRRVLKKHMNIDNVTNAWLKAYEIYSHFKVLKPLDGKTVKCFFNAELPGAFIFAAYHYVSTMTKHDFSFYASSLILDMGKEEHSKPFGDHFGLYKKFNFRYLNAPNMNGDVSLVDNIKIMRDDLKKVDYKVDFYSSDLGKTIFHFYRKEEDHFPEFLGHATLGLITLNKGGSMVIKLYGIAARATMSLVYILSTQFEESYLYKPFTSHFFGTEIYFVGKGYKGEDKNLTDFLIDKMYIVDVAIFQSLIPQDLIYGDKFFKFISHYYDEIFVKLRQPVTDKMVNKYFSEWNKLYDVKNKNNNRNYFFRDFHKFWLSIFPVKPQKKSLFALDLPNQDPYTEMEIEYKKKGGTAFTSFAREGEISMIDFITKITPLHTVDVTKRGVFDEFNRTKFDTVIYLNHPPNNSNMENCDKNLLFTYFYSFIYVQGYRPIDQLKKVDMVMPMDHETYVFVLRDKKKYKFIFDLKPIPMFSSKYLYPKLSVKKDKVVCILKRGTPFTVLEILQHWQPDFPPVYVYCIGKCLDMLKWRFSKFKVKEKNIQKKNIFMNTEEMSEKKVEALIKSSNYVLLDFAGVAPDNAYLINYCRHNKQFPIVIKAPYAQQYFALPDDLYIPVSVEVWERSLTPIYHVDVDVTDNLKSIFNLPLHEKEQILEKNYQKYVQNTEVAKLSLKKYLNE
jgi:hypothetical protein